MTILQTLIDAKIDIDIHQCAINQCSPFIYCLHMDDLKRVKCLLENGASVHGTVSGKRALALEFVLRERTTDYLRLFLPDTGNQVNLRDAEGRFSVDLCVGDDFADGSAVDTGGCKRFKG